MIDQLRKAKCQVQEYEEKIKNNKKRLDGFREQGADAGTVDPIKKEIEKQKNELAGKLVSN